MAIAGVELILTVTQIILYSRNRLAPLTMLCLQIVQSTIWTALWVIAIIGLAERGFYIGFVILTAVAVSFWSSLLYASVVYHRDRKVRKGRTLVLGGDVELAGEAEAPLRESALPPKYGMDRAYSPQPYENYREDSHVVHS
ncbi:hypothetical protein MBLNU459_g0690t1 [Dothideomycetes sp. NU459]